jgi:hypothetical protein
MPALSRTLPLGFVTVCALVAGCASSSASRNQPVMASASQRAPVASANDGQTLTRTSYRPAEVIVREGMELQWAVQSPSAPANRSMGGKAVVGPDGSIELGPYGSVHVAGLSLRQAKAAVTNQLGQYVADAQVTLVPVSMASPMMTEQSGSYPVNQTAWHPYQPAAEVTETMPAQPTETPQSTSPVRRFGQRVAAFWNSSRN